MKWYIQDKLSGLFLQVDLDDHCELVALDRANHWETEEHAKACLVYLSNGRSLPHGSFESVPGEPEKAPEVVPDEREPVSFEAEKRPCETCKHYKAIFGGAECRKTGLPTFRGCRVTYIKHEGTCFEEP